jgi:hypothetical protein
MMIKSFLRSTFFAFFLTRKTCLLRSHYDNPALVPQSLQRKLHNQILSLNVLRTEATFKDFTVDLSGEFSENARGGTPFGPVPLQMPNTASNKMAELLVSDYVVNSLLFQMHK